MLRSLAELRSRFAARIDDDLNFLQVKGHIRKDNLKDYSESLDEAAFEKAQQDLIALPSDDDLSWGDDGWREGKPIIRTPQAFRIKNESYFFGPVPKSKDDSDVKWVAENFKKHASNYCHYSRHVLFGTADRHSEKAFDKLGDLAGRYLYKWSELNFKPDPDIPGHTLNPIDIEGHDYWMDYIILLANRNIRGCPLVIQKKSSLNCVIGPWNGPHWILLKSNLFQASVDAIDTFLWLTAQAQERSARALVSTAEPFQGDKAMPESSVRKPTIEHVTELVGAIGRFAFDDEGTQVLRFGGGKTR